MINKTKKSIFKAAIKVFSESSYDGATLDDIAAAAGISKGTLYYHFKSKDEIFKYIITEGMELIKEQLDEAASREDNSLLKLKSLCRHQLRMVYEKKDFFKVIMSQLWGKEIRQSELREAISDYIRVIEVYIKEAMEAGVIKKGEPYFMAYMFFGALCSSAIYEIINKDNADVDEVMDSLMQYILYGIQA
jgi:AcrR family transcriptional regulator